MDSTVNQPIYFNKPCTAGNELTYIAEAIANLKISGDGKFTKQCHQFFEQRFGFQKVLLTTSCTDALEMAAILANIQPGDEVIAPSYTFVSTVNAFVLRGARIVFADSYQDNPNMDASAIEPLITPRTKIILPVHYAGVACDMDAIMAIAKKHNLLVIEDAAQAIDSYYNGQPLGSIGQLAAFSFHETKNIIAGEGGMLVINDASYNERAEIIREKGTDRSRFFRGEVDKYGWVDMGSSFLPSDMIAAFLFAQLEALETIQQKRKAIWEHYNQALQPLAQMGMQLPTIPSFATNNAHMYYIVCSNPAQRNRLIKALKEKNIHAVFHYQSLHQSKYYAPLHDGRPLPNADRFTDCLLRLPFYNSLTTEELNRVCTTILDFCKMEEV
jgi:dTDP-4-amino-4,6-dideoxygalactose transaminase